MWLIVFSSNAVVVGFEVMNVASDKVAVVGGCLAGCRWTGHDDDTTVTASAVDDNDGNTDDNRRFRMRTATTITCQDNTTMNEMKRERE